MKATQVPDFDINRLNFLVREYNDITKSLVSAKNRLGSTNPEATTKTNDICMGLKTIKDKISRTIGKKLELWDIWNKWLVKMPGLGPWLAGELILLLFYRFLPICPKCGTDLVKKDKTFWCEKCNKSVKGEGNLKHRIDIKNFRNISSWWHYMGRHIENGAMPKRVKGVLIDYSPKGRTLGFHIGKQFTMQTNGHPYRQVYDSEKADYEKKRPEWTKGHRHNAARNNTVKLFLSHFISVAYEIEEWEMSKPYACTIMRHDWIRPFEW